MSFEQIEAKFNTVWKQIEDFIPIGSKEETERFKRKGLRLEQVSEKKLKTSKEVSEEVKAIKDVLEDKHLDREDLNQLWRLVKETLSIRPPTSDKEMELWLYDTCGVHHVTSKDKEIFMLVEKDYPLRKGLAIVMICYKLQIIILFWKLDCSWSIKFRGGLLGIKYTRHSHCQLWSSHCQKKIDATAEKIALLWNSSSNCQSKSYDSYAKIVDGIVQIVAPTTAEQRLAKKNKLKARGTLLMALPDKDHLKLDIHKDARSLMEAIKKRFGGDKETKKVQKTLFKQQYENFSETSSESLDQIHDMLQKPISQMETLGETISQEDINLKFLRSLPSEWKTQTLIWRNKADLEEPSLDDL
nr:ribonuclease H-like domain-containing protein [Tanacetum cinerariifolium]